MILKIENPTHRVLNEAWLLMWVFLTKYIQQWKVYVLLLQIQHFPLESLRIVFRTATQSYSPHSKNQGILGVPVQLAV